MENARFYRLRILPRGTVSKKDIGEAMMLRNIDECKDMQALTQPMAMAMDAVNSREETTNLPKIALKPQCVKNTRHRVALRLTKQYGESLGHAQDRVDPEINFG